MLVIVIKTFFEDTAFEIFCNMYYCKSKTKICSTRPLYAQEDVKQFLTLQQRGMAHLLDTARKDLAALNTIAEGMAQLVRG
ncbi:hypothetical protein O3G_MSEX014462 [Manduca sexta]|uniref:Nup54 C-terminal interacting domain-containing protein n=1 Tax=Manduca sexta TaxID=7130 RepID=A0A922D031_MANSE|nr:hypothetical protein O3G_MSEX014462 [Manduca sexta]KAG6464361.1 hypothetical protein O3G_MSEX014462 [Manduca sexta]